MFSNYLLKTYFQSDIEIAFNLSVLDIMISVCFLMHKFVFLVSLFFSIDF